MVARMMIGSNVFAAKGQLSLSMKMNLLVRGSGIAVNDCLLCHGWNGSDPVATTIMTIDPSNGTIRGVRFDMRGVGPLVKLKAKELWSTVKEDIDVMLKLNDLSTLPWLTMGEARNQTSWVDSKDMEVVAAHPERGLLSWAALEEMGAGGFSARFTVLPIAATKVLLYGGIIPMSKEELTEKTGELNLDLGSPFIPTIALKLGFRNRKLQNSLTLDLIPAEKPDDKVGLGTFPIFESVGTVSPKFPESEDVAEQLSLLLRRLPPTNNVNITRLRTLLQSPSFPTSTTGTVAYEWPEFVRGEALDSAASRGAAVSGLCLFILCSSVTRTA